MPCPTFLLLLDVLDFIERRPSLGLIFNLDGQEWKEEEDVFNMLAPWLQVILR